MRNDTTRGNCSIEDMFLNMPRLAVEKKDGRSLVQRTKHRSAGPVSQNFESITATQLFFICNCLASRVVLLSISISHIDASHSRQPLVKGERLVRYEVNAVILSLVQDLGPEKRKIMTTPGNIA